MKRAGRMEGREGETKQKGGRKERDDREGGNQRERETGRQTDRDRDKEFAS